MLHYCSICKALTRYHKGCSHNQINVLVMCNKCNQMKVQHLTHCIIHLENWLVDNNLLSAVRREEFWLLERRKNFIYNFTDKAHL